MYHLSCATAEGRRLPSTPLKLVHVVGNHEMQLHNGRSVGSLRLEGAQPSNDYPLSLLLKVSVPCFTISLQRRSIASQSSLLVSVVCNIYCLKESKAMLQRVCAVLQAKKLLILG